MAPIEQREPTTAEKLKKIRMKTQVTPTPRDYVPEDAPAPAAAQAADNSDAGEPGTAGTEETKPLSPQFAALAKAKRAAQVKEAELLAREERLKAAETGERFTPEQLKERIKGNALEFILEHGGSYDQLTNEVLKSMEGGGPALTKVEQDLRTELKTLRDELSEYKKTQTDSKTSETDRSIARMQTQADQIIATDDAYQLIRETNSNSEVSDLIKRVLKEDGEVLSVKDALDLIENDLLEESLKFARIKKVQSQLTQQQTQASPGQDGGRSPQLRTLSNRDTASPIIDRKARAIAAFHGKKLA